MNAPARAHDPIQPRRSFLHPLAALFAPSTVLALLATTTALAISPLPAREAQQREISLPGWPISYAFATLPDGSREILLLLGDPGDLTDPSNPAKTIAQHWNDRTQDETMVFISVEGAELRHRKTTGRARDEYAWQPASPPALFRIADGGLGELERVTSELPGDIMALAADPDGKPWLLSQGRLLRLTSSAGEAAATSEIASNPYIDPRGFLPRFINDFHLAANGALWIPARGALLSFQPGAKDAPWAPGRTVPLHSELNWTASALYIRNAAPKPFPSDAHLPKLLAMPPEAIGKLRLRTELIDLTAAPGEEHREIWSRFASPESVLQSSFFLLDGQPALSVWTLRADKIRFSFRPQLRVFLLRGDRTRAGRLPILSVDSLNGDTRSLPRPQVMDTNGDGRDDLVLIAPDKKRLRVSTFLRRQDGRFDDKAQTSELKLDGAIGLRPELFPDQDVTGDGLADLVAVLHDAITIYPGNTSTRGGRRLFAKTPSLRIALTAEGEDTPPRLALQRIDLDGDGRGEILIFSTNGEGTHTTLKIVRF